MGSQMIKPKREWKCSNCGRTYIKWEGTCYRGCQFAGTLEEVSLNGAKKVKPEATAEAKRLRRRAKQSERDIAKRMLESDGPDPAFRNIASNTGRVGFITGMRIDAISKSYVTENKNRKMPSWLIAAWLLINQRAVDFNKNALLHVDPPNMPKDFIIQGAKRKLDTLAIISQTRHEELIATEHMFEAIAHAINSKRDYAELQTILFELQSGQKTDLS